MSRGASRGRGASPALPAARAAVRELRGYMPEAAACETDLSDNTNLFGAPPTAARLVRESVSASLTRYPDPTATTLRHAIATHHGVPTDCVATGCGSDDVLDATLRAFTGPGDGMTWHDPTFSMIPILARLNGLTPFPVSCPGTVGADHVSAMCSSGARVLYLCGPNNPTGAVVTPEALAVARAALRRAGGSGPSLLVLDQAYAEFEEPDERPRRPAALDEPVIVTRTLSKAFGLAGLRIGYAIGPAEMIREIEKARGPYKVNALAERAGVAAMTEDLDWVRVRVAEMRKLRERFAGALRSLGFEPLPSAANFVLVPVADAAAADVVLRRAGVAVRAFAALPGIGDALRITIGPWSMLSSCLAALAECRP